MEDLILPHCRSQTQQPGIALLSYSGSQGMHPSVPSERARSSLNITTLSYRTIEEKKQRRGRPRLTTLQCARAPTGAEAALTYGSRLDELLTQNSDLFTREQLRLRRFRCERLCPVLPCPANLILGLCLHWGR